MITYEEALKIARKLKHGIDCYSECKVAYIFRNSKDPDSDGGDGPCVVLKDTGEAVNYLELFKYTDEETEESDLMKI